MTAALYNEIEPFAVEWLKNLERLGHIAAGSVDARSIADLEPRDLDGVVQFHAFAGIGVWSHALRLAGWPDDLPVWTGSCPCQPFSAAGRKRGLEDERHLWPAWFRLVAERRPAVVFGEQVASPDGLGWFDAVSADLEGAGYAVGAADLCAASVGAPHIRQRLWFVAVRVGRGLADDYEDGRAVLRAARVHDPGQPGHDAARRGADGTRPGGLGDSRLDGAWQHARELRRDEGEHALGPAHGDHAPVAAGAVGDSAGSALADADGTRRREGSGTARSNGAEPRDGRSVGDADDRGEDAIAGLRGRSLAERERSARGLAIADVTDAVDGGEPRSGRLVQPPAYAAPGFWSACDWIPCRDGKLRPVEPGSFPLAHGATARVGRLRAYGNAIVAQVGALWIRAAIDAVAAG